MLDADALQISRDLLIDQLVGLDDLLLFLNRIDDCLTTDTADDACGQIDHFFVAFVNGPDGDAVDRAAIHLVNDDVL